MLTYRLYGEKEKRMKAIEIKKTNELNEFTKRCLFNEYDEWYETFKTHWRKAKSTEEFKKLVFQDASLKLTQGYAVLSKESEGHWYRVRDMFGNRQFQTVSDAGSVCIGNELCQVHIPNGRGDGFTRVGIFKKNEFNQSMMNYFTSFKLFSEMNIYFCDCNTEVSAAILEKGSYSAYFYEDFVAFVKV